MTMHNVNVSSRSTFVRSKSLSDLSIRTLVISLRQPSSVMLGVSIALLLASTLYLQIARPEYALPFIVMGVAVTVAVWIQLRWASGGVPMMGGIAVQHGVTYCTPLLVENRTVELYLPESLTASVVQFAVFISFLVGAWLLGKKLVTAKDSAYKFAFERGARLESKLGTIGITFLAIALLIDVSIVSGTYWAVLGEWGGGVYPIVKAVQSVCSVTGSFAGAFMVVVSARYAAIYWLTWSTMIMLSLSSLLLSTSMGMVVASVLGLFLSGGRVPIKSIAIVLCVIGFLNEGKFEIRERYWENGYVSTGLSGLPTLYADWASASFVSVFGREDSRRVDGQKFLNRIDNLQNLLFAVECIEVRNMETIGGQGYALVPKLLIPRILWPSKPRTHEGQDLLNVHFRRQTYEQSRTTFIAWGLLAEAIGNFGLWFGPAVLGMMLGLVSGAIESWSIRKSLLSLEGFAASMLFVFAIISFEMNLSVLVTSLAQSLFVLLVCGAIIRDLANRFVEKT